MAEELLRLTICSASKLQDLDWVPGSGGSDPYCEVQVLGKPIYFKTEVIENTSDPVWNASTELRVSQTDVLEFTVSDYDTIGKADLLGRVSLSAARLLEGFDEEVKLQEAGKKQESFLKLYTEGRKAEAKSETPEAKPERATDGADATAGAEAFPWTAPMEKLKRLRRESIESGLTIREVRQLSMSELERWLEEERLRRQRRQTRRDLERGRNAIEEEEGQWWTPGDTRDCPKCGAEQPELSKFCAECGAPWNWQPKEVREPPAKQPTLREAPMPVLADELPTIEEVKTSWADTLDSPGPAQYQVAPASAGELWPDRETQELRGLRGQERLLQLLEGPYAYLPKTASPRADPWQSQVTSYGAEPSVAGEETSSWWEQVGLAGGEGRWAVSSAPAARSATHFGIEVFRRFLHVESEPSLRWLADEMMHVELPKGMYPIDPQSVECRTLDSHSRCPSPPPALAFVRVSRAGHLDDNFELFFEHPYQEAFDHAAAAQLLAERSQWPAELLEVAEAAWTESYGQSLSNWEENLQLGGFVHRVTGHHAQQETWVDQGILYQDTLIHVASALAYPASSLLSGFLAHTHTLILELIC